VLFEDLCQEVLELRRLTYRPKTYLAAKNQINHLLKTFLGRPVSTLNRSSWAEHAIRARTENPFRNLNDDRKYFLVLMGVAFQKGLLQQPIVKIPKPDQENEIGRELSDDEISRLLAVSKPDFRFLIETALKLGWRKNEMLHCRWDWFDWSSGCVRLPAYSTKTKKSRVVPLPAELLSAFKARYNEKIGTFVFPAPKTPNRPQLLEKRWNTTRERAKVNCRWHDLRHTCATRMLRGGISVSRVCKVLGMSARILMRIYDHVQVDDLRAAVEVVQIPKFLDIMERFDSPDGLNLTVTRHFEVPSGLN
jgi:integrase